MINHEYTRGYHIPSPKIYEQKRLRNTPKREMDTKSHNTPRINICLTRYMRVLIAHDSGNEVNHGAPSYPLHCYALNGAAHRSVYTGRTKSSTRGVKHNEKSTLHRVRISPFGRISEYSLDSFLFRGDPWCLTRPSESYHIFRRGSHMGV